MIMSVNAIQNSKNVKQYKYPTRYPWRKGRKNISGLDFQTAVGGDGVVFINTTSSVATTRYFPTVESFQDMRSRLKNAMDGVTYWNDMDVPDNLFSVPVSVVCNMGSFRFYIRTPYSVVRLSEKQCVQLLWMFDNAMEDLDRWEKGMKAIFGEDIPMIPRE